jgi:hypothetical protein
MPIVASDISYQLSGGAANANPNASLGGVISSEEVVDAVLHNLFDVVSGDESAAGDTEYRCIYVKNNHATLAMLNTKLWIQAASASADSAEAVGLGSSAVSATEQTVANEGTAPGSVTFSAAANEAAALAIGDIPAGGHKAIWIRRVITEGASAANSVSMTIRTKCETAA